MPGQAVITTEAAEKHAAAMFTNGLVERTLCDTVGTFGKITVCREHSLERRP
jgi:hypothetical protein